MRWHGPDAPLGERTAAASADQGSLREGPAPRNRRDADYLQVLQRLDPARVTPLLCAFTPRHRSPSVSKPSASSRLSSVAQVGPRSMRDLFQFARGHKSNSCIWTVQRAFLGGLGARLTRLPTIAHYHSMLQLSPIRDALEPPADAVGVEVDRGIRGRAPMGDRRRSRSPRADRVSITVTNRPLSRPRHRCT